MKAELKISIAIVLSLGLVLSAPCTGLSESTDRNVPQIDIGELFQYGIASANQLIGTAGSSKVSVPFLSRLQFKPEDLYNSSELAQMDSLDYPANIKENEFRWDTFPDVCPGTISNSRWTVIPGCGRNHPKVSMYFTLSDQVKTVGPKIKYNDREDGDYVKKVFRKIIQSAHRIIQNSDADDSYKRSPDQSYNENFTYYTWLVAALTTPLHESKLHHFRSASNSECDPNMNDDLWVYIKQGQGTSYKTIAKNFKNPMHNALPRCDQLPPSNDLTQLLTSFTHGDFGIMQFNFTAHRLTDRVKPHIAFNTYAMIDEGLEYLFDPFSDGRSGFIGLRKRVTKWQDHETSSLKQAASNGVNYAPTCNFNYNPFKRPKKETTKSGGTRTKYINYANTHDTIFSRLIGGTWAAYNQGSQLKEDICRFMTGHPFDNKFLRDFKSLVVKDSSYYHRYLPKDSLERLALDEIVHNFRRIHLGPSQREKLPELSRALDSILMMPELGTPNKIDYSVGKTPYKPTHLLLRDSTFHSVPTLTHSSGRATQCGTIEHLSSYNSMKLEGVLHEGVQTIYTHKDESSGKSVDFLAVRIPKYSNAVKFSTPKFVQLIGKDKVLNVRSSREVTKNCSQANLEYLNSKGIKHNCIGQWVKRDNPNENEFYGRYTYVTEKDGWVKVLLDKSTGLTGWVSYKHVDVEADTSGVDEYFTQNCTNRDIYYVPKDALLNTIHDISDEPIFVAGLKPGKKSVALRESQRYGSKVLRPVLQKVNFWEEYHKNLPEEINGELVPWREIPSNAKFLRSYHNERAIKKETAYVFGDIKNNEGELWYYVILDGQAGYLPASHLRLIALDPPDETELELEGTSEGQ